MKALWLPFEVADFDEALAFYSDRLGLVVTDRWERDGERGVVLRAAGEAFIELVSPPDRAPVRGVPLAFELPSSGEVDAAHAALAGLGAGAPHRYPRGHYGFVLRAPAGAEVMLWSEAE